MNSQNFKSDLALLCAACIWGFAFVAQAVGMKRVPAFAFNGIRFALGAVSLLPLFFFIRKRSRPAVSGGSGSQAVGSQTIGSQTIGSHPLLWGLLTGTVLFCGASLQQLGLKGTTAGHAGFITDLYIVIVPVIGLFLGHRPRPVTWVSVVLAFSGLYLISVTGGFTMSHGDFLELLSALMWSAHIILIDRFTKKMNPIVLSLLQYTVCSALSLGVSFFLERFTVRDVLAAAAPILYGGVCSVGVGYTLQVIGQRHAKLSHSAILMTMESVFAALGGAVFLHENMGLRGYIGCGLMISAMILCQIPFSASRHLKSCSGEKA